MDVMSAFMRARLDEEEALARAAGSGAWHVGHEGCSEDCPVPCPRAGQCHSAAKVIIVATGEERCVCELVEGDDITIYPEGGHNTD
jgi:hypothetical protein